MARVLDVYRGLDILRKYCPDTEISSQSETLCAGNKTKFVVTEVDEAMLKAAGWYRDEEFHCWAIKLWASA